MRKMLKRSLKWKELCVSYVPPVLFEVRWMRVMQDAGKCQDQPGAAVLRKFCR